MNDNNAGPLSAEDKWRLITRDIPRGEGEADYVVGEEEIRGILASGRDVNLYWGTGVCSPRAAPPRVLTSFSASHYGRSPRRLLCAHLQDWRLPQGRLPRHHPLCRSPRLSRQHEKVDGALFFSPPRFGSGLCDDRLVQTDTSCLSKPCDSTELLKPEPSAQRVSRVMLFFSFCSDTGQFVGAAAPQVRVVREHHSADAAAGQRAAGAAQVCARDQLPAQGTGALVCVLWPRSHLPPRSTRWTCTRWRRW